MSIQQILPVSIFDFDQSITISYRGRLAEKASAINCTAEILGVFDELVMTQFSGCLCYWEGKNKLVVGLIEDVGLYYPHW